MNIVFIHTEFIKLSQAMKLAGIVDQGSDAKIFIQEGKVKVNGTLALERGKKLYSMDIVEVSGLGSFQIQKED